MFAWCPVFKAQTFVFPLFTFIISFGSLELDVQCTLWSFWNDDYYTVVIGACLLCWPCRRSAKMKFWYQRFYHYWIFARLLAWERACVWKGVCHVYLCQKRLAITFFSSAFQIALTFIKRWRRQTDNFSAITWLIKQQSVSLCMKGKPWF